MRLKQQDLVQGKDRIKEHQELGDHPPHLGTEGKCFYRQMCVHVIEYSDGGCLQPSKLEAAAGRRLFVRDTHSVRLTADGEAMTGFAKSILDTANRAGRYFTGSRLRGKLRFGVSEDFVSTRLPELLREFVQEYALVDLELNVGSAQGCTNAWTRGNST